MMRWKVTLVAEVESGPSIEHDIASVDRDDRLTPATLGLSIAEGKAVLAAITQAMREHGVHPDTPVTVLSDGDAGLRAIQRAAAPEAEPVLDWFHIAMRRQHVHQLATGAIQQGQTAEARTWLLDLIERAKWALWNGQLAKTLGHLSGFRVWTWNARGIRRGSSTCARIYFSPALTFRSIPISASTPRDFADAVRVTHELPRRRECAHAGVAISSSRRSHPTFATRPLLCSPSMHVFRLVALDPD